MILQNWKTKEKVAFFYSTEVFFTCSYDLKLVNLYFPNEQNFIPNLFPGKNLISPHRQRASGICFSWSGNCCGRCTNQDERSAAGSFFFLNNQMRYMSSQINLMNSDTINEIFNFFKKFKKKRRRRRRRGGRRMVEFNRRWQSEASNINKAGGSFFHSAGQVPLHRKYINDFSLSFF